MKDIEDQKKLKWNSGKGGNGKGKGFGKQGKKNAPHGNDGI